ncbi:MAG TPA: hypothetical protein VJO34_13650 [Methylomirabilota bacterium]|nr:hypothetical protein [Methylomirabilota bacterium]
MGLTRCAVVMALAAILGMPLAAGAEMNVSGGVNIQFGTPPPPPPVVVATPPAFVVIPGSVVSYAPSLNVDIFLFQGSYYYFHNGAWFNAKSHKGPWVFVQTPPPVLVQVPAAYYKVPPGHLKKAGAPGHGSGKGKGKD